MIQFPTQSHYYPDTEKTSACPILGILGSDKYQLCEVIALTQLPVNWLVVVVLHLGNICGHIRTCNGVY